MEQPCDTVFGLSAEDDVSDLSVDADAYGLLRACQRGDVQCAHKSVLSRAAMEQTDLGVARRRLAAASAAMDGRRSVRIGPPRRQADFPE